MTEDEVTAELKKIIFYLNDLGRGGAQRVVSNLSNRMAADGYDVTIAMSWKAEPEYEVSDLVHKVYLGYANDSDKGRLAILKSRVKGLRKLLKTQKPDCILVFGRSAIYRALMAKRTLKVPMIISIRIDPRSEYIGLKNRLCKIFLERMPSGCVFQTREAMSFFSRHLQRKSMIIENQIGSNYLDISRNPNREKFIVTFGRMAPQKNQALLVEAFAKIHLQFPDYSLRIYGSVEDDKVYANLHHLITQMQLEKVVTLLDNTDKVQEILDTASLFVLSSDYEGMPNALLEAMAMGVPCIATDCPCGGPREVIRDHENGLLVPIRNVDRMSEAIQFILENPDLAEKMGKKAMQIIDSIHPDVVYGKWKQYIESKMNKR